MIMRKFHNSIAVGFFMGTVVAGAQMFLMLFFIFSGLVDDRIERGLSAREERLSALLCFIQSLLLGSFATVLAMHRSEILKSGDGAAADSTYVPPKATPVVV